MTVEFTMYKSRDRYFIRHADSLKWDIPLLLGHGEERFVWSTELNDAKPFQYLKDAMLFMRDHFPNWHYITEGVNCRLSMSFKTNIIEIQPTRQGVFKVELHQLTALSTLIRT